MLSSLTLPVAVVRLCNWVQRALPDVECHVVDGHLSYGQPINEAGERKARARLFAELDALVDDHTLIGFTTFANRDIVHALPFAREAKRRYGAPVLLGGYAASTCAPQVAASYPDLFDGVVASAGEYALVEILKGMGGQRLGDLSRVPNLVYVKDGELHQNPKRPAPRLAELPPLDLAVLKDAGSYEMLPYFTSAGCPFSCDFCFEPTTYPGYDKNSVANTLRDIDAALAGPIPPYVSFVDPLFGADPKLALPVLAAMRERGVRYTLYTRADILTPEMFKLMEGHCAMFFLGLEAASESSLKHMNKAHNVSRYMGKMRQTARLAFEHGVTPQVGLIPNYPLNRQEDADAVFKFLSELTVLHGSIHATGGPGFLVTVFGFCIWYGLPHHRNLAKLESQGMTWAPGFPETYHGERVDPELRRDVRDASPDYSHNAYLRDRKRLYASALATPMAMAHQADHYSLGFVDTRESLFVRLDGRPLVWTDADEDVLDVKQMHDERIAGGPELLTTMQVFDPAGGPAASASTSSDRPDSPQ